MSFTPKIGAHVSVAGGLNQAINRAEKIGADCLQIFSSPPQRWGGATYTQEEVRIFRNEVKTHGLLPIFIHAPYLINLASENPDMLDKSKNALIGDLLFADKIGASGVIFHLGSHKNKWNGDSRKRLVSLFEDIVKKSPKSVQIIFENAAGGGNRFPTTIEELGIIARDLPSERISFCLDTAHLFAAGYNLRDSDMTKQLVDRVGELVGWERVSCLHVNDSLSGLGSGRDRHEDIGIGEIGNEGFTNLFSHKIVREKPLILETPGIDKMGPDKKNVSVLRNLVISGRSSAN